MNNQRQFLIVYRLLKGNSPQQRVIIPATDIGTARRIFEQQNPGTAICTI
jgi:hypothetical protein